MKIKCEFSGGMELLFNNQKQLQLETQSKTLGELIQEIRTNVIHERPELFADTETIRPGVLVLVNDADWDLLDTTNYVLEDGDTIVFISTLHGG
ncbi:ubiquitin-related modifier 1 [Gorgonomyces haynaldii]|nr:ubiquitin-related modifier 1 [Gorgonomyces haynaldii]